MKLLAIDTATEACSVALWLDGDVHERFDVVPRGHAERVLPWAEALLQEADVVRSQLDAIAVSRGPGAFTGVRLAVSLAQGLGLALDRPVVPVSTLATLAMQAPQGDVVAASDARMGEVYLGWFRRTADGVEPLQPECVLPPAQAVLPNGSWHGVGTGFAAEQAVLRKAWAQQLRSIDDQALPHAADLARLAVQAYGRGEALPPEQVEPAYLRNNVALTLAEQAALRAGR